ncbi:MAG: NADP-dependent malic enzyme [Muribaculum sp.]|nr:NADP-dependent malic enzyme [Muribaculum sp.]
MAKVTKRLALEYHEEGRPGKIEITPTKPYSSQLDLSLAYSPGVAWPCLEIKEHPLDAYKYTDKGNLVAVISNGTAVLGLGNIGALAGKPVMEGKALLFKIFSGLDAFDIEVNETDPKKFVAIVKALQPTFGGINLEDIKSPECFEIEKKLKEECDIPVMHDDQHGTAIISGAGLLNALELQKKKINEIKLVVNGAGAAAISCTRLYVSLGVKKENIVMCDSKGVIRKDRPNLSELKKEFATERDLHTLAEAMVDADVFLGLSVADVLTQNMVKSMAPRPIVFALANPEPEINYDLAKKARPDIIVATGRSDYPNQINNVIGFPYIFRGALDCGATAINEEMKIAAVHAIARLAKQPVPSVVDEAYGISNIKFGQDYILPKALDPRLLTSVAPAVAKAAMKSGIARRPIKDWENYNEHLQNVMGNDGKFMRHASETVHGKNRKVVFSEGESENMIRAAVQLHHEKTLKPILLGNKDTILQRAEEIGLDINGIDIINPRSDKETSHRKKYADIYAASKQRDGVVPAQACKLMHNSTYFGMMMVNTGDADALINAQYSAGNDAAILARDIVGIKEGYRHFATMHIVNTRNGVYFLADTAVNPVSDTDTLVDVVRLADESVRRFSSQPVIAMLSYSNFGSNINDPEPRNVADAVSTLHRSYPEIIVDGEMQADYALNNEMRDKAYPFSTLAGKKVNTLVFPSLGAANISYKMLLGMGIGNVIGPIQVGLRKPIYFCNVSASVREIVNIATLAALDSLTSHK